MAVSCEPDVRQRFYRDPANAGLLRIVDASSAGYMERSRLEVLTRAAAAEVPPSFGAGTGR